MIKTCRHPDRDMPKLLCGHPIPCPYHTAVIDLADNPPSIKIPITSEVAWNNRSKLSQIAQVLENKGK